MADPLSAAGIPIIAAYVDGGGNLVPVDAGHPLPTTTGGSTGGAAHLATSQVAAGAAAATLAVARSTRRRLTIKNTDPTNPVYIGPATVTAGNGMPLLAGESITVTWVGLIQVIAPAGAPVVALADEYD